MSNGQVDSVIISLLNLDPAQSSVSNGSGFGMSQTRTSKISTRLSDGSTRHYFVKSGKGEKANIMFAGEHASLTAIHTAVPSLCPRSYGHGEYDNKKGHFFLVTDYLDTAGCHRGSGSAEAATSLAAKLAKLHITAAPIPEGYENPQFGFAVPTCCGDTQQPNEFSSSWADFYRHQRLEAIALAIESEHGNDRDLQDLIRRTCHEVVPRLLGDAHLNNGKGVTPVVVHGDLWSGNYSRGKLLGMAEAEDVIYDSSACYAHSEYDLGIMRMFGGFGGKFLQEYHRLVPKTEPINEYEDRIALYELYHHLNHHALFGSGYRRGAMWIMQDLLRQYGDTDGRGYYERANRYKSAKFNNS